AVEDLGAFDPLVLEEGEAFLGGDLTEAGAAEEGEPEHDDEDRGGDVEEWSAEEALEVHVRTGSRARHLSAVKGTGASLAARSVFAGGVTGGFTVIGG